MVIPKEARTMARIIIPFALFVLDLLPLCLRMPDSRRRIPAPECSGRFCGSVDGV